MQRLSPTDRASLHSTHFKARTNILVRNTFFPGDVFRGEFFLQWNKSTITPDLPDLPDLPHALLTSYLSLWHTMVIIIISMTLHERSIFPTAKVLSVPQIRQSWSKPYIKMGQFKTFVTTQYCNLMIAACMKL